MATTQQPKSNVIEDISTRTQVPNNDLTQATGTTTSPTKPSPSVPTVE